MFSSLGTWFTFLKKNHFIRVWFMYKKSTHLMATPWCVWRYVYYRWIHHHNQCHKYIHHLWMFPLALFIIFVAIILWWDCVTWIYLLSQLWRCNIVLCTTDTMLCSSGSLVLTSCKLCTLTISPFPAPLCCWSQPFYCLSRITLLKTSPSVPCMPLIPVVASDVL